MKSKQIICGSLFVSPSSLLPGLSSPGPRFTGIESFHHPHYSPFICGASADPIFQVLPSDYNY